MPSHREVLVVRYLELGNVCLRVSSIHQLQGCVVAYPDPSKVGSMGTRLVGVLAKPCMDGPGVPFMQPPHHLPIRCELAVLWVAQGYELVAKPDQSSPYHAS